MLPIEVGSINITDNLVVLRLVTSFEVLGGDGVQGEGRWL